MKVNEKHMKNSGYSGFCCNFIGKVRDLEAQHGHWQDMFLDQCLRKVLQVTNGRSVQWSFTGPTEVMIRRWRLISCPTALRCSLRCLFRGAKHIAIAPSGSGARAIFAIGN